MRSPLGWLFARRKIPPQPITQPPTPQSVQLTAGPPAQQPLPPRMTPQPRQGTTPPKSVEQHDCAICGEIFPTADELSAHFPSHKELFDSIEETGGKGEMRTLGESIKFEDYLSFQHTEATCSDLESLVMTESNIRAWGRRKEFTGMKWVGVIIAGALGLVIVLYILMELMPGLFG